MRSLFGLALAAIVCGSSVTEAAGLERVIGRPVYVDSAGREWLDVASWTGVQPYTLQNYCSLETGACQGVFEWKVQSGEVVWSMDLSGYTWASRDDVRDLFYDIGGLPDGALDDFTHSDSTHAGAANFFNYFSRNDPGTQALIGVTGFVRTFATPELLYTPGVRMERDVALHPLEPYQQFDLTWTLRANLDHLDRADYTGLYLYRVPEPTSFSLLALGIAGIGFTRRRRSVNQERTTPMCQSPMAASTGVI